ncbi:MAG: hypothetical protein M3133_03715 [Actinomycetota bacterium]|nr:hypothetical protein [Actinomycetota bacterium]
MCRAGVQIGLPLGIFGLQPRGTLLCLLEALLSSGGSLRQGVELLTAAVAERTDEKQAGERDRPHRRADAPDERVGLRPLVALLRFLVVRPVKTPLLPFLFVEAWDWHLFPFP